MDLAALRYSAAGRLSQVQLKLADHAAVAAFGVCLAVFRRDDDSTRRVIGVRSASGPVPQTCAPALVGSNRSHRFGVFSSIDAKRFAIAVQGCGGSLSF